MAVLSTVHTAGEGNQSLGALVAPLSIHAVLTAAPAQLVRYIGSMAPRGVWHVGSFGFGAFPGDSANPAVPSIGFTEYLHAETQDALVPQLNGGLYTASSLWWRWKPGVTVDLTVTTASSNRDLQPWDRNAAVFSQSGDTAMAPNTPLTQLWSYTVPAGRILRVSSMQVMATPLSTPAAQNGYGFVVATVNGSQAAIALVSGGGQVGQNAGFAGGSWDLPPGTLIAAEVYSSLTDVLVNGWAAIGGYLFDVLS